MANKTKKWFVVATEGATTDGRAINRSWIEQMAKNYDPKTYGARINLEHIKLRWYWGGEPHSKCYGDVLALKAEENEEGKLQLLAQLEPTDELIALNKDRQKIYTSIEVDPNFADSGEAYLVGLAVTDSPASLGTEMLQFAAGANANPLADRKTKPENLFTAAIETQFGFSETEPEPEKPSLFAQIRAMFSKKERTDEERFADTDQAVLLLSDKVKELTSKVTALSEQNNEFSKQIAEISEKNSEISSQFTQLKTEPAQQFNPRPQATGNNDDSGRFF